MQTLWSRALQVKAACRCPQCTPRVHGVGRRATTSATGQSSRYSTSATLWYSGIFAAAATYDVAAKKRRREQWDNAIAGMKEELGQPTNEQAQHDIPRRDKKSREHKLEEETVRYTPVDGPVNQRLPSLNNAFGLFRYVDAKGTPKVPINTGPDWSWNTYNMQPANSIYATEWRKKRAETTRWTPKKQESVMLSCDKLQIQILLHLNRCGVLDEALQSVPEDYRAKMSKSKEALEAALAIKKEGLYRLWDFNDYLSNYKRLTDDEPITEYDQDDDGAFHETTRNLNRALEQLFLRHESGDVSRTALLAKIAYNLGISTAPPTVHTINTLIIGLSETKATKESPLVDLVIRTLRETHIRPNEVTLEAVQKYFIAMDRGTDFVHWLKLMRGERGGLTLARRDITINERGESRLIRIPNKQEGRPDKIVQLPTPTPRVFDTLVEGVLKFSGFDQAIRMCEVFRSDGWGLSMDGLTLLLSDRADDADWEAGSAVWSQMNTLHAKEVKRNFRKGVMMQKGEGIPVEGYAAMLRLCHKSQNDDMYRRVLGQATYTDKHAKEDVINEIRAQEQEVTAEEHEMKQRSMFGKYVTDFEKRHDADPAEMMGSGAQQQTSAWGLS